MKTVYRYENASPLQIKTSITLRNFYRSLGYNAKQLNKNGIITQFGSPDQSLNCQSRKKLKTILDFFA
jgi:hypothetical protein